MNLDRYDLTADPGLSNFDFVSIGPNGSVHKRISFQTMAVPALVNLAFGDVDSASGSVNDFALTNNQDAEKVLATVLAAVYIFTEVNKTTSVYAKGSTAGRTRLYRMGISRFATLAQRDFFILGLVGEEWEPFQTGHNYEAFVVRRK